MAEIYSVETGYTIATDLQGCEVCDEALRMAMRIARERGIIVALSDDDGEWLVDPAGNITKHGS